MVTPLKHQHQAPAGLAGRQLGRYEVLTQLAAGGMAAVYVARAQGVAGFERMVALKVLHPHLAYEEEFISMFLDEARLAARIRNLHVVATHEISDSDGDGYFLVMDYVEGDTLSALLKQSARRAERLPLDIGCRIVLDALAGLAAAHELCDELGEPLKLVHRDVSPHNVMVGKDGIARLTDFGVAKAEKRLSSTQEGKFKGKLSYMAPEHASSGRTDQRSDLFSMGIVLWETLTGQRLFRGHNNGETLNKVLSGRIPAPSELWSDLAPFDAILARALSREPEGRFQNADEFIRALEDVAKPIGIASRRVAGECVADLASEKLGKETTRIRDAIERFGRTEIGEPSMPFPREGSVSGPSRSGVSAHSSLTGSAPARPAVVEEPTLAATPSAMSMDAIDVSDMRPSRTKLILVIAAILLCLVAIAWVALRGDGDAPIASPGSLPEQANPAAPESASPAAAATGTVATGTADEVADDIVEEGLDVPEGVQLEDAAEEVAAAADTPPARTKRARTRRSRGSRGTRMAAETVASPMASPMDSPPPPRMVTMRGSATDDLTSNPYLQ